MLMSKPRLHGLKDVQSKRSDFIGLFSCIRRIGIIILHQVEVKFPDRQFWEGTLIEIGVCWYRLCHMEILPVIHHLAQAADATALRWLRRAAAFVVVRQQIGPRSTLTPF